MLENIEKTLSKTILGKAMTDIQDLGCSWFFVTSSILSILSGREKRNDLLENAQKDEQFQNELQKQKELFEDEKEAQERAFKLWLKKKQREWARKEANRKFENEYLKDELKFFFDGWPLEIAIQTLIEQSKNVIENLPMNIIIAKHSIKGNDRLTRNYNDIVNRVSGHLENLGLVNVDRNQTKVNVYRFREDNSLIAGPALANIYAVMSTFPTVVLLPKVDKKEKKVVVSLACWNQDSLFPFQKRVCQIDFDFSTIDKEPTYLESKIRELTYLYATIAIVLYDVHSLLEYNTMPVFPDFLEQGQDIKESYPQLIEFAINEYASILSNNATIIEKDGLNKIHINDYYNHLEQMQSTLTNVIQRLKQILS